MPSRPGPNRLAGQTSPYLRQHRDNPVDWFPWGDEAFEVATGSDRPVLLSIGYSACHWCHVMAHESFEDEATAEVMNAGFVSIKVDREERPDVDAVYMEAVQALTGGGGWPMTVFLLPDGRPFLGGTYFPKRASHGQPAFTEVLAAVSQAWKERRAELIGQATALVEAVEARSTLPPVDSPGPGAGGDAAGLLEGAYRSLRSTHDEEYGGFGRAPKFPQPAMVELLLRAHSHNRSDATASVITTTLDAMASGGIYDHLGGGFSRYSVDRTWLVPHFEKMLYDQAGLVRTYLHGWQHTGHRRWLQVVEETIAYVLRDLANGAGGLCSAEDADSEGEEGLFYLWTPAQMEAVLGPSAVAEAAVWWGVTESGNFEGSNILHRPHRGDLIRPPAIEAARAQLFEARSSRVRPGLDDQALTEWNAMFAGALAEAGAAAGRSDWVAAAEGIGQFLLANLRNPSGRWMRSWQDGRAAHLAYAVDHAWLTDSFVRLYEATGRATWLDEAVAAADAMIELFWDEADQGLFTTGRDGEALIVRAKDFLDGATPSANSVAAVALVRLAALADRADLADRARAIVDRVGPLSASHPSAFCHLLGAVDMLGSGTIEVVVPGRVPDLLEVVTRRHLPNAVMAWGEEGRGPLWEDRRPGVAYVCRGTACLAPVSDPEELGRMLDAL
ncbi:MAG TPA: thioredoxin domain-containing protein [Acidimicrobiales bacterium]|nr:thioredoxin domain-containing protein [Acidimicrobiales bacterium]